MTDTIENGTTEQAEQDSRIIHVPLNKLKKSPSNARKVPHSEATIEALAASIAHKGLIQNLVVEPEMKGDKPTGAYLVTAGEGRRLAYLLRAKRKEIRKNHLVRCWLDTENDPSEVSLDENVKRLGVFEGVVAKRFHAGSYSGIFRVLHGSSQTFVDVLEYSGPHAFSDELVYVVDPSTGRALPLSPLYFWGLERNSMDASSTDMHEYDIERRGAFGFKSTQPSEGLEINADGEFISIHEQLAAMRCSDPASPKVDKLVLTSHED